MTETFDWPGLLRRVNGNAELARRLLGAFFADHDVLRATAEAALAEGRTGEARRLVHRTAGTAGNLSLAAIEAAARSCEAMVVAAEPPSAADWSVALARLEETITAGRAEVRRVLDGLAPETPAPGRPATPAVAGDGRVLGGQLAALLARNDLAALSVVERWKAAEPVPPQVDEVVAAVRALDFARAAALLAGEVNENG